MLLLVPVGFVLQATLLMLQPVLAEVPLQEMLVVVLLRVGVCLLPVLVAVLAAAAVALPLPAQRLQPQLRDRVPAAAQGSILPACAIRQGQATWAKILCNKQVEQVYEALPWGLLAAILLLLAVALP